MPSTSDYPSSMSFASTIPFKEGESITYQDQVYTIDKVTPTNVGPFGNISQYQIEASSPGTAPDPLTLVVDEEEGGIFYEGQKAANKDFRKGEYSTDLKFLCDDFRAGYNHEWQRLEKISSASATAEKCKTIPGPFDLDQLVQALEDIKNVLPGGESEDPDADLARIYDIASTATLSAPPPADDTLVAQVADAIAKIPDDQLSDAVAWTTEYLRQLRKRTSA